MKITPADLHFKVVLRLERDRTTSIINFENESPDGATLLSMSDKKLGRFFREAIEGNIAQANEPHGVVQQRLSDHDELQEAFANVAQQIGATMGLCVHAAHHVEIHNIQGDDDDINVDTPDTGVSDEAVEAALLAEEADGMHVPQHMAPKDGA